MSVGSRSMSSSDRDVPMAKAIFFTWEEKSSSIPALRWTGASSVGARWEGHWARTLRGASSCTP